MRKLPNGYGTVFRNGKNRKNPFRVMVTVGWRDDGSQIRKNIGYANSREEGYKMLSEYHGDPYDLDYKNITFEYIWNKDIIKKLERLVEEKKMTESNLKALKLTFKNHCKTLHNCKMLEIRYKKMQDIIDNSYLRESGRKLIRTVCVKIFNCAIDDYEIPIKNNPAIRLKVSKDVDTNKHIPFTENELKILWNKYDTINDKELKEIIKINLVLSYSGMRPNELFTIKRDNVFLSEDYMIGGSKTEAGKNRIIPIYPTIKPILENWYNNHDNSNPFIPDIKDFNYGKFSRRYEKAMEQLNLPQNHTPYDCRHTFATRMKKYKADEYLLKIILGHSVGDITEKVYTHRSKQEIILEVRKLPF